MIFQVELVHAIRIGSFQVVVGRFLVVLGHSRCFTLFLARCRSFQVVSSLLMIVLDRFRSFQVFADRFRSFRVVPCFSKHEKRRRSEYLY